MDATRSPAALHAAMKETSEDYHSRLATEARSAAVQAGLLWMAAASASALAGHAAATRWSDVYRKGPAPLKRIVFAVATMGSFAVASHGSSVASTYTVNDLLMREMEARDLAHTTAAAARRQ